MGDTVEKSEKKPRHQWTSEEARRAGRIGASRVAHRNKFNPDAAREAAKARWAKKRAEDAAKGE